MFIPVEQEDGGIEFQEPEFEILIVLIATFVTIINPMRIIRCTLITKTIIS